MNRNNRYCHVVLIVVLLMLPLMSGWCQGRSTMGTDFWFSFMKGRIEAGMSVAITGIRACTGTISNPNTGWSEGFSVPAGSSVIVNIDTANCYNYQSGRIVGKGIHITTTDTVSVYASNFLPTSFDVTFILPTPSLCNDYIVQTFESWRPYNPSEILVVGVEDSTVVTIEPTSSSVGITGGGPITRVLDAGECFFMQSVTPGDYSGTHIYTTGDKRIAVFNGHECAHVPSPTGSYCDHLFEQCLPTVYWGRTFVATMTANHSGDMVKVTAGSDNCEVFVNLQSVAVLDAGESYSFAMTGTDYYKYIQTTQPSMVNMYIMSKNVAGPDGDPSMILLPPVEQQISDVVFLSYNNSNQLTNTHYINIVTETSNAGNIYLDGAPIGVSNFHSIVVGGYVNSVYSYARVMVSAGSHHLYSTGATGFVAHAYGVGNNESYGYALGFSLNAIANRIVINGNVLNDGDTVRLCRNASLTAYSFLQRDVDSWSLGGIQVSSDDTLTISDLSAMPDTLRLRVLLSDDGLCGGGVDTVACVLLFSDTSLTMMDSVTCGSFYWNGIYCSGDSVYTYTTTNAAGCDSLTTMSLTFEDLIDVFEPLGGCDSMTIDGESYGEGDTVFVGRRQSESGCDTNVWGVVHIHASYHRDDIRIITLGDSLLWIDGNYYCRPTDGPTAYYQSVDGCDSVIRLVLLVDTPYVPPSPPPIDTTVVVETVDSMAIWVPNVFTPDGNTNNHFRVFSYDVTEMRVFIFRRNGLQITEFDGLTGGWDGTYRGIACPQETYTYCIVYRTAARPQILQRKVGTVTLLR